MPNNSNETKKIKQYLTQSIIIPSIAILSDKVLFHPLETIFTFQQKNNISFFPSIRHIRKTYTYTGFYLGLSPTVVISALPSQLSIYGVYYTCRNFLFLQKPNESNLNYIKSGLISGFISSFFLCPPEAKRVRDTFNIKVKKPYSRPTFFRGYIPVLLKTMLYCNLTLAGTDITKDKIGNTTYSTFFIGTFSSAITTLITTPIDVLKTEMMSDTSCPPRNIFQHINKIHTNKMYFNSFLPRFFRLSLGSGFVIGTINLLNKNSEFNNNKNFSQKISNLRK